MIGQKELGDLFEKYVPDFGPAETLGGELVRAINRIGYRYVNDGDRIGVDYGNETCNPAYRFIKANIPDLKIDRDLFDTPAWEYEDDLEELMTAMLLYFKSNPQVFETPNTEDMLDYREESDTDYLRGSDDDE